MKKIRRAHSKIGLGISGIGRGMFENRHAGMMNGIIYGIMLVAKIEKQIHNQSRIR